ncbi:MAG: dihydropyrimidinase [Armatimonadota bacterium]|nr:dihydropyrimidinase [Armatimonadota bacterium]
MGRGAGSVGPPGGTDRRALIRGATVVTASETYRADVLIAGERIAAIGADLARDGARVVDAGGLHLLPGGIDVHTHLDMPLGDIAASDDFESGQVAAAFGGTTSHLDFVIQPRGASLHEALDQWHARARDKACIDYGFHMTITDPRPEVLDEVAHLPARGVPTVKVLMAYRGRVMVEDADILRIMRRAAAAGMLTMVHCEHGDAIDVLIGDALAAGRRAPRDHGLTRPAVLEAEATGRAIALAEVAGAPLYVVHVTCAGAVAQIRAARARGLPVWGETCPQYLCFTADDLDRPGFEGAKYVCSPPLRTVADQQALWRALRDGALAVVSTDHCPFHFATQKRLGMNDFTKIPNGLPVIEHRLQVLHHLGVCQGRVSLNRLVEIGATNPARLFGLYPRKGTITVGADADLALWDLGTARTISAHTHHMRVDYSLFEGMTMRGAPVAVWSRGEQIVDGAQFVGARGRGRYLPRAQFSRT